MAIVWEFEPNEGTAVLSITFKQPKWLSDVWPCVKQNGVAEIISFYFSFLVNPWNFDERAESPKKWRDTAV